MTETSRKDTERTVPRKSSLRVCAAAQPGVRDCTTQRMARIALLLEQSRRLLSPGPFHPAAAAATAAFLRLSWRHHGPGLTAILREQEDRRHDVCEDFVEVAWEIGAGVVLSHSVDWYIVPRERVRRDRWPFTQYYVQRGCAVACECVPRVGVGAVSVWRASNSMRNVHVPNVGSN